MSGLDLDSLKHLLRDMVCIWTPNIKQSSSWIFGGEKGKVSFTNVVRLCNDHGRARRLDMSFAHGWVTKVCISS